MSIIESRLADAKARIQAACQKASRNPTDVCMLAVTKGQPISTIAEAYRLGIRDFGENYLQEALPKIAQLPSDIRWHFIGKLQSNKAQSVAKHFTWVHSIHTLKIAQKLASYAAPTSPLNVCLQLNWDEEPQKNGFFFETLADAAEQLSQLPSLSLKGIMVIPKPCSEPSEKQAQCNKIANAIGELPQKDLMLSMGMSGDFEEAIIAGSHFIRLGRVLFGERS